MSTFEGAAAKARAPGKTLLLQPWVFADEWSKKPEAAVCVGLRLLSDREKTKVRLTGEELADQVHPQRGDNWLDTYNDAAIRQVAALALCDPNDVKRPFELMQFPESDVSDALTSRGALFIFEALNLYEIQSSPIGAAAGEPELKRLVDVLPLVSVAQVPPGTRRLVSVLLDELEDLFGHLVEAAAVDDAAEELPVVVAE